MIPNCDYQAMNEREPDGEATRPSQLPAGWDIKPTKHVFSILNGATPSSSERSFWDGDIYWATPEDIGSLQGRALKNTKRTITRDGYNNSGTQIAPEGSIVLTTRAPVGNLALTEIPLCTNQGCKTLVPKSAFFNTNYFYYQLLSRKEELCSLATGTTFQELGTDALRAFEIWLPSASEQHAIATYLDNETTKIDALIAEKERLLSLLAEKRRALITQAVTRGLNPDAPMRDSGVEWLGEIPGHWEISKLKMLGRVRTGIPKGRNLGNRETVTLPYLRVANVQDGYLNLSDVAKIEVLPEEAQTYRLEKGDVLMNEGGDADKLGRGTVWNGSLDPCLHQNHVFAVRCFHVESTWLAAVTSSDYAKFYFESRSKQSTNLASISSTNIQELPVVLPPQEERLVIVKYLEEQTSKLDGLGTIAKRAIKLLQERRAALISAAVTGQIRVGRES